MRTGPGPGPSVGADRRAAPPRVGGAADLGVASLAASTRELFRPLRLTGDRQSPHPHAVTGQVGVDGKPCLGQGELEGLSGQGT